VIARFDDLLQGGLRELLGQDENIEIVAAGVEARRMSVTLAGHRPSVAILDGEALPRLSEVREITARHPNTKLVVLTHAPSAAVCAQLVAFGASACLDTRTQSRDVLSAIHLASRGMRLTPDPPADGEPSYEGSPPALTAKETEVLPMLREGRSNAEIALDLNVGIETIRTHARNLYRKLGVSSRRELIAQVRPAPVPPGAPPAVRRRVLGSSAGRRRHASRPH
jgi:DNA-binding NarL/FixJ family response regulator